MKKLELFFDCSSPWTYFGFEATQKLLEQHPDVEMVYRPILVGGVFNAVNQSVYQRRENSQSESPKSKYSKKDMQDWARYVGVEIVWPDVFPVNAVKSMRGAFVAMEQNLLVPYARAMFKAYWTDKKDISQDDALKEVISGLGMDESAFFEKINDQLYKDKLRETTDELIRRGGFGSPTFFVNDTDMYWGNDRIPLIEAALSDG